MATTEAVRPWREGQAVELELPDFEGGSFTRTGTVQSVTGEGEPGDVVTLAGVYGENIYRIADDGSLEDRFGNRTGWERTQGGDD